MAAIIVFDNGMSISTKNRQGVAPSNRAASNNSSGIDLKNCLGFQQLCIFRLALPKKDAVEKEENFQILIEG